MTTFDDALKMFYTASVNPYQRPLFMIPAPGFNGRVTDDEPYIYKVDTNAGTFTVSSVNATKERTGVWNATYGDYTASIDFDPKAECDAHGDDVFRCDVCGETGLWTRGHRNGGPCNGHALGGPRCGGSWRLVNKVNENVSAKTEAPAPEPLWREFQNAAPGECPCGIARAACTYHAEGA